jgi:CheY-like chemotaxis protein
MDYHLAGGDVLETLAAIRAHTQLAHIPVLVTSGMDHQEACLAAGADGFILKPFRPSQLLERIAEVMDASEMGSSLGVRGSR